MLALLFIRKIENSKKKIKKKKKKKIKFKIKTSVINNNKK